MNLIVDTCTLLWLSAAAHRLSPTARELIEDPANKLFLSAASAWEISVKHSIGKLPLPQALSPAAFIPEARKRHRIEPLAIAEADNFELPRLPALHNDPFDRMLVCQAIANQMAILTPDPLIHQYPVGVKW